MILSKSTDRLYLQRDASNSSKDIAIDLPTPLPQHQIDGIRFLFKLFIKKAPGVILNDPSGYGKCLQTVLFLNAVRSTLKKPILVLSNSVTNWTDHFKIWTNCGDDELAVETSNPFSKKQVFINPVKDGVAFCRRSWSIIVLHDENSTYELLRLNCNADYKIWVTSNDLKANLYTLASIYEWLHPNQKFNIDLFSTFRDSDWDAVEKSLLLDAVVEDFLIRRNDFCLFPKAKNVKPSSPSPIKATLKNKDPTGTKVKRSKKRRIADDINNDETINKNKHVEKIAPVSSTSINIESFICIENPNESENFNFIQNPQKNVRNDEIAYGSDTMEIEFKEAVNELVENEKSLYHSTNEDSHVESTSIAQGNDEDATQVYVLDNYEVGVLVPATEDTSEPNIGQNTGKCIEDDKISRKVIIPEIESESSEISINTVSKLSINREEPSQDIDRQPGDNKNNEKSLPEDRDSDKSKSINGNTSRVDDDNMNSNKELAKKSKIEKFDDELAEFEAKALKKFKNSILDSIF